MSDDQVGGVQSVSRAVRALELIAQEGELGVTDLGRGRGVHKATASRLAATLAAGGLIERDPVTDRYRLGFGLIRLVGAAMASIDLVRTAHPVLEELADRTHETVNIGVLSGDGVVDVVAALSVSGPSFRVRSIDLPRLGRLTIDAAGAVSWRLGHTGRRGD